MCFFLIEHILEKLENLSLRFRSRGFDVYLARETCIKRTH